MTTILEVQDEIRKVQGELEELTKRLQEEVPEAERAQLWKEEELLWKEKELLWKEEEQLREKELLLMRSGQNSTALVPDRSGEWIKHMLMPGLTTLPQHDYDLANVLFPEKHGKLPVTRRLYHERLMQKPDVTESFLIEADDSAVPTLLTSVLRVSFGRVVSETYISARIVAFLEDIFELCRSYSPYRFTYQFFFQL
jgi:hypothetical protein